MARPDLTGVQARSPAPVPVQPVSRDRNLDGPAALRRLGPPFESLAQCLELLRVGPVGQLFLVPPSGFAARAARREVEPTGLPRRNGVEEKSFSPRASLTAARR
jgi:hypothetical protein